jgi:hypothetical protein
MAPFYKKTVQISHDGNILKHKNLKIYLQSGPELCTLISGADSMSKNEGDYKTFE